MGGDDTPLLENGLAASSGPKCARVLRGENNGNLLEDGLERLAPLLGSGSRGPTFGF